MRVTIALGGNALLQRGQPLEADVQWANVRSAATLLAEIACDHEVVLTHGNGPQIGLLALQSESNRGSKPLPLDVLGAESEGMLGYLIEQELSNSIPTRNVAVLLTRVEIDPQDPAFATPSKPIGPMYCEGEARRLATDRGWSIRSDGEGSRRVVASPTPRRILELETIRLLIEAGHVVICAGGGGIPVARSASGRFHGVEAVVDKDLTAALLAEKLNSNRLILLTDVAGVYESWPDATGRPISTITADQLGTLHLDPGSMGPKIEAARQFVQQTGNSAAIGSLSDALAVFRGTAGTQVCAGFD